MIAIRKLPKICMYMETKRTICLRNSMSVCVFFEMMKLMFNILPEKKIKIESILDVFVINRKIKTKWIKSFKTCESSHLRELGGHQSPYLNSNRCLSVFWGRNHHRIRQIRPMHISQNHTARIEFVLELHMRGPGDTDTHTRVAPKHGGIFWMCKQMIRKRTHTMLNYSVSDVQMADKLGIRRKNGWIN